MITNPPFGVSWKPMKRGENGSAERQRQILRRYAALLRWRVAVPTTHALQDGEQRESGGNRL